MMPVGSEPHPTGPSLLSRTAITSLDEQQEGLGHTPPCGQTQGKRDEKEGTQEVESNHS